MGCNPDICIICLWPNYQINVAGRSVPLLGHAGVLLINGGTGPAEAHYYEYGRYVVAGGNPSSQGNVRDYAVPGIVLRDTGWPTVESLHQAVKMITRESGKNTYLHGNVDHKCGDCYEMAVAYAEAFRADSSQHYNIITNSCMAFSFRVNKAGGWSWFGPVPVWNSRPAGQMEVGLFHNYVAYNPDGDRFRESVWQI